MESSKGSQELDSYCAKALTLGQEGYSSFFLKPRGCLHLIILLLILTPEAECGSHCLCSCRGQGRSLGEISQPMCFGFFIISLPVCLLLGGVRDRVQQPDKPRLARGARGVACTQLPPLCTSGLMSA